MLGDFASYLISSEILLCPTASPYRSSLFAPPNEPPPFFDQLFATTLPGAFTATSFTTSKGQRASLFLSPFGGGGARRNLLFPLVISARPFAREDPTSLARKISAIVRKRRENFRFELRIRIRETCFQRTGLFPRRIEQRIVTKTLIGDMRVAWKKIPRNGVRRLGENRRGVDRGCRTYIYIYTPRTRKTDRFPMGSRQPFPTVRTTAIFDPSEKASKAYQSLTR